MRNLMIKAGIQYDTQQLQDCRKYIKKKSTTRNNRRAIKNRHLPDNKINNKTLTDARAGGAEDHRAVADWCGRCRILWVPRGDCDPTLLRPPDPRVRLLPWPRLDRPLISP